MGLTNIQWCDYTFNAWMGCRKVAPECANCYITETPPFRFRKLTHGSERVRTAASTWKQPIAWNRAAEKRRISELHSVGAGEVHHFVRPRVFCLSLGDWLDDEVPIEWLADLLKLIHATPNLDWLLLTKRPQNWRQRMEGVVGLSCMTGCDMDSPHGWAGWMANRWINGHSVENVWIGVSAGADQAAALEIPSRIHFLSCEPMLHPVDLSLWIGDNPVNEDSIPGAGNISSCGSGIGDRQHGEGVENSRETRDKREFGNAAYSVQSEACGEQGIQGIPSSPSNGERQEDQRLRSPVSVAPLLRPDTSRDGCESQGRDSERQQTKSVGVNDAAKQHSTRDQGVEATSVLESVRPKESNVRRQSETSQKWVILGGESGAKARPCNTDWIRDAVRQCRAAGVPVFVKQMGANCFDPIGEPLHLKDSHGGDMSEWPHDLRVREFPNGPR